jgi:hypothetical protein
MSGLRLASAGQPVLAVGLGAAALAASLLNAAQERRTSADATRARGRG